MRRIVRGIWKASAALSLLLCLAAAGLWVRTYYVSDELSYYRKLPSAAAGSGEDQRAWVAFRAVAYHALTARGEIGLIVMDEFWPLEASEWFHRSGPAQGVPLAPTLGTYGFYAQGWRGAKAVNNAQALVL